MGIRVALTFSILAFATTSLLAGEGNDSTDAIVGKWGEKADAEAFLKEILADIPETAASMSEMEKNNIKKKYLDYESTIVHEFTADGKYTKATTDIKITLQFSLLMLSLGGLKMDPASAKEATEKESGYQVIHIGTWKKQNDKYEISAKPDKVDFTFNYAGQLRDKKLLLTDKDGKGVLELTRLPISAERVKKAE